MPKLTLGCRQVQARPLITHTRARLENIRNSLHLPTPAASDALLGTVSSAPKTAAAATHALGNPYGGSHG